MFLLFSHLLIIALCLVMRIFGLSEDAMGIVFVVCSSVVTSIYVLRLKNVDRWVKFIILIGFIMRILLVVIDVFVERIPGSGSDDDVFYDTSVEIYDSGYALFGQKVYGGAFSKIMSVYYYLVGSSRFSAQYLNVLLYVVCAVVFLKSLINFKVSKKQALLAMLIFCLLPNVIMTNSILRRETFIELCVCGSLLYFSKWHNKKTVWNSFMTIAFLALASLFHTAMIFGALVFALYFALFDEKKNAVSFSLGSLSKMFVVFVCVIVIGIGFLSMWNNKFSSLSDMDDIYTTVNKVRGGSVYLENYKVNNIGQLLLFTPPKLFYFLFSPFPWQFRNMLDVISFVFDSLIYIFLVVKIIRSPKPSESKALFWVFFLLAVVFALGTFTSGTAIRHRSSLLPFLIACYCILKLDIGAPFDSDKHKNERKEFAQ